MSNWRFKALLLFALICAATHVAAQGYIFTWRSLGDLQVFQGSFELTDAEMQPGTDFGSQLFLNSIAISDPDGVIHRWSPVPVGGFDDVAVGYFYGPGSNDFVLQLSLFDSVSQTVIDARNATSSMDERTLPDFNIFRSQSGVWIPSPIPEPSTMALLAAGGAAAWFVKRRKLR